VLYSTILTATLIKQFNNHHPVMKKIQDSDLHATDMQNDITYPVLWKGWRQAWSTNKDFNMRWKVITKFLITEWRLYFVEALHKLVISLFNNNTGCGHFRALRTAKLSIGNINWLYLDWILGQYIADWEICLQIKYLCQVQYRVNIWLALPLLPRNTNGIDHISNLPRIDQVSIYCDIGNT